MIAEDQERRIRTICLFILAAVAVACSLYFLAKVLVPFVLALFIAIALTPLIDLQVRRLRMPRALAVVSSLLLGMIVLGAVGLLVSISVRELAANSDEYAAQTRKLVEWAVERLPVAPADLGADPNAPGYGLVTVPAERIRGLIVDTSSAIMSLVSDGMLVVIFVCFLLFGGSTRPSPPKGTWGEIVQDMRKYLLTKVLISFATGALTGGVLWILGIRLAMVFGLMAFLLNFIPSIGSIVATLLPLPVVLLTPGVSAAQAIGAILLPGVVQFVLGNVLEPRMMGKSFNLHPVTILLTLIFWGMLWGIVGMFLATPLTAVIKTLFTRHPYTAPLARVLAGRVVPDD